MTSSQLLLIYCPLIVAASLLGGLIPHWIRLTHTRMQIALSFVAGAMLGVGLLHLVPHAFLLVRSIDRTMWFALGGFLLMFFIERVFHFHHHGAPDEPATGEPAGHDHECAHGHHDHAHAEHEHGRAAGRPASWAAALLGLALHSLLDGVALAASIAAESSKHHGFAWAGLAVFFVIVLHKPFDSLTLGTLMAVGGRTPRHRHLVNVGYALAVPCGALLFQAGLIGFGRGGDDTAVGCILALAGGMFLCIATSDLLPELQFHTHDRFRLSLALLAGLALSGAIVFLEERGHDHNAPPSPAPQARSG